MVPLVRLEFVNLNGAPGYLIGTGLGPSHANPSLYKIVKLETFLRRLRNKDFRSRKDFASRSVATIVAVSVF